jgi:hypothetical protein
MRKRSLRARSFYYHQVAEFELQFEAIGRQGKWEAILKLLRSGWLEPIQEDDLFELYVLVVILETLKTDLGFGEPSAFGLIKPGRREIAVFSREPDGIEADLYFDQSPVEIFELPSVYQETLGRFEGLTAYARRPDITVRFRKPGGIEHRLLVECKRTDDDGYRRDSVYKALAYLKDFGELWANVPQQRPKVLVVFPKGINPRGFGGLDVRELDLVGIEDRVRLRTLISASSSN